MNTLKLAARHLCTRCYHCNGVGESQDSVICSGTEVPVILKSETRGRFDLCPQRGGQVVAARPWIAPAFIFLPHRPLAPEHLKQIATVAREEGREKAAVLEAELRQICS